MIRRSLVSIQKTAWIIEVKSGWRWYPHAILYDVPDFRDAWFACFNAPYPPLLADIDRNRVRLRPLRRQSEILAACQHLHEIGPE